MTSTREETLSYPNNPSSSSSPITVSDHLDPSFLTSDPSSSLLGSASNSFQNETGFLGDSDNSSSIDAEYGFSRPDFRQSQLAGTVRFFERHVFLCYKNPSVWPPRIEAAEFDRLPRLLSAAMLARKADMKKDTRLTICEGHDGTETSNGDVLIFPDMIRYRRLTHFDVDTFVEEVLVKDGEWMPGTPERLKGSYVFVCFHGSRDRRCGVCGPALVSRFKEEIELRGLQGKVSVSPCSHIEGHKYAGNVIVLGSNASGVVTGHWYGYVTPEDVPMLLEQHIGKGEIVDWLWRNINLISGGQMGLSEDEQVKSQELRLQLYGAADGETNSKESTLREDEANSVACRSEVNVNGCSQQNGNSCCQSLGLTEKKGSPNHLEIDHFRMLAYYLAMPFPIEKAPTKKITILDGGVTISELVDYPVRGLVFEGGNTVQDLSNTVSDACICLQDNNVPYNVLISDSGKRIFLLPQCYAEKQALGEVSSELLDTQVNPAVWEISGHMVLKRKEDFDEASEANAWRLLAEVSLSEERFQEVNSLIFEAISYSGNNASGSYADNSLEGADSPEELNAINKKSHPAMTNGNQECLVQQ